MTSWEDQIEEILSRGGGAKTVLPRVYLAGKITGTSWRKQLFHRLHTQWTWDRLRIYDIPSKPQGEERQWLESVAEELPTCDGFAYCGPFYLDTSGSYAHDIVGYNPLGEHGGELDGSDCVRWCFAWLEAADVVFVWLDDITAYGTLVEIGHARALNKPIFVGVHPGLAGTGIWFPLAAATAVFQAKSAEEAWRLFVTWYAVTGGN